MNVRQFIEKLINMEIKGTSILDIDCQDISLFYIINNDKIELRITKEVQFDKT